MLRFAVAIMAAVISTPAFAQDNSASLIAECDRLAASDVDPARPASAPGLAFIEVDPTAAVPACVAAAKVAPGEGRVVYQLGRALSSARQDENARAAYQLADSLGYSMATHALGIMHYGGRGGPRDLPAARECYERAALADHPFAMQNLAMMYERAEGGLRDLAQAQMWYARALAGFEELAAAKSYSAMAQLWFMYEAGQGVAKDAEKVSYWRQQVQSHPLRRTGNAPSALAGAWEFGRVRGTEKFPPGKVCDIMLTLRSESHGYRVNSCHPNESYWTVEIDKLLFKNRDGGVTTTFRQVDKKRWEGDFLNMPGVHYITR